VRVAGIGSTARRQPTGRGRIELWFTSSGERYEHRSVHLDRLLEPLAGCFSSDVAAKVGDLRADVPHAQHHAYPFLADKHHCREWRTAEMTSSRVLCVVAFLSGAIPLQAGTPVRVRADLVDGFLPSGHHFHLGGEPSWPGRETGSAIVHGQDH